MSTSFSFPSSPFSFVSPFYTHTSTLAHRHPYILFLSLSFSLFLFFSLCLSYTPPPQSASAVTHAFFPLSPLSSLPVHVLSSVSYPLSLCFSLSPMSSLHFSLPTPTFRFQCSQLKTDMLALSSFQFSPVRPPLAQ